jgi:hypothetical protein
VPDRLNYFFITADISATAEDKALLFHSATISDVRIFSRYAASRFLVFVFSRIPDLVKVLSTHVEGIEGDGEGLLHGGGWTGLLEAAPG